VTPITVEDRRRDYRERRLIAYGLIGGRARVCVYTVRGETFRIISLRRANRMEIDALGKDDLRRSAQAGGERPPDWDRIDGMTDEDIARQIAENPDVAPDMSEALERGEFVRLHIVNIYGIRTGMGLSHGAFAERFGLDPSELKEWEAMGGVPDKAIRTYLRVIEREPEAVARTVAEIRREAASEAEPVAP
jgi:putative transcriptional regulator